MPQRPLAPPSLRERVGEALRIPPRAVVVANELGTADADTFRRAAWTAIAAAERPAELVVVAAPVPGVPDASPWDSPDPGPTAPPPDGSSSGAGTSGTTASGTMDGSSVRVA